jgi:hypothetical protein
MTGKSNPPDPMRAELTRLRQILWDIAVMTGHEGPEEAPPAGRLDPDVPEIAVDSVKAYCAEYLSYTGPQGRDVNPDAGPDDRCRCGQTITWFHGSWWHLYNEALHRQPGHREAMPATGWYDPSRPDPEETPDAPEDGPVTITATSEGMTFREMQRLSGHLSQALPQPSRFFLDEAPGVSDERATYARRLGYTVDLDTGRVESHRLRRRPAAGIGEHELAQTQAEEGPS